LFLKWVKPCQVRSLFAILENRTRILTDPYKLNAIYSCAINMIYFKAYNQSKFKLFLISIFFLLFVFSCNGIEKEEDKRPSDNPLAGNVRTGNPQAARAIKTGKLPSGLHDSKSSGYVEDQIIVKFVKGTDLKTISVIQKELRLETLHIFSSPDLFLMKITDHTPVKDIQKSLNKYKEVKYSEPNYKMSIDN